VSYYFHGNATRKERREGQYLENKERNSCFRWVERGQAVM
jgi:hypothetical protein